MAPSLLRLKNNIPLSGQKVNGSQLSIKASLKSWVSCVLAYLRRFDFPGNARELKNLAERINIYCDHRKVTPSDLRPLMPSAPPDDRSTLKEAVAEFERDHIAAAIRRHDGSFSRAARELGLERSHLYKKVKKLGIDVG